MGFIYLVTNTITGHQYVGQTGLTIEQRWKRHCDCVRRNEQQSKTLSKTSPNKRAIAQFDMNNQLLATYESAKEAERQTGIDHSQIAAVCRGKRRQTHNYIWKYLEDIE